MPPWPLPEMTFRVPGVVPPMVLPFWPVLTETLTLLTATPSCPFANGEVPLWSVPMEFPSIWIPVEESSEMPSCRLPEIRLLAIVMYVPAAGLPLMIETPS